MKIHCLSRKQILPITQEEAWPFFSTPRNLEQITPAFLRFQILSEIPDKIHNGLIICYRIRAVAGVPMTWVTEIKQVEQRGQFVDEQRIGPFRFWHHLHRFRAVAGGVEMEDTVHYVMPWGWLGELVHALFVRARLRAIFDFRRDYLENYFGAISSANALTPNG
jgi:ligand-binding SRPBCC domain-containing protein